eukprot:715574-Lingulodinium_polyedra.AAC.1
MQDNAQNTGQFAPERPVQAARGKHFARDAPATHPSPRSQTLQKQTVCAGVQLPHLEAIRT